MKPKILQGDCLAVLQTFKPNSFDACVTDPPYHLTTGKKGGTGQASLNLNSPAGRARISTGFMGKQWDGGDIAFTPELWAAVFRVLKPGAHLLAFGGTRTYHRMACAIEDAGFEIRDCIQWLYGSGFPKSHNIGRGFGTALKPANEPIVLARKPLSERTVAANVLKWGTGAINVDGCRVECEPISTSRNVALGSSSGGIYGAANKPAQFKNHVNGRWPANVIHDGSEEVVRAFPKNKSQSGGFSSRGNNSTWQSHGLYTPGRIVPRTGHDDSGSAARFFYCAKTPKTERCDSKHPTVKPVRLIRYLCRLIVPPGGKVLDPFAGSGTTAEAAIAEGMKPTLIEREREYLRDINRRLSRRAA